MKKTWILIGAGLLTVVAIVGVFFANRAIHNKEAEAKLQESMDALRAKYTKIYRVEEGTTDEELKEIKELLLARADLVVDDGTVKINEDGNIEIFLAGANEAEFEGVTTTATIEFVADYDGGNREAFLDGSNILSAKMSIYTEPATGLKTNVVDIQLDEEGTKLFAETTKREIGNTITILYDGEVIMAPKVLAAIENGQVQITGIDSEKEAKMLAASLSGGKLTKKLIEVK